MTTRNVVLTSEQDLLVESLVASGRFQNASEVLRSGLRLLEEQEADIADLRARVTRSVGEAETGLRAAGSGEDAVRRAFARAGARRG